METERVMLDILNGTENLQKKPVNAEFTGLTSSLALDHCRPGRTIFEPFAAGFNTFDSFSG